MSVKVRLNHLFKNKMGIKYQKVRKNVYTQNITVSFYRKSFPVSICDWLYSSLAVVSMQIKYILLCIKIEE